MQIRKRKKRLFPTLETSKGLETSFKNQAGKPFQELCVKSNFIHSSKLITKVLFKRFYGERKNSYPSNSQSFNDNKFSALPKL